MSKNVEPQKELESLMEDLIREKNIIEEIEEKIDFRINSPIHRIVSNLRNIVKHTEEAEEALESNRFLDLHKRIKYISSIYEKNHDETMMTLRNKLQNELGNTGRAKKIHSEIESLESHKRLVEEELLLKTKRIVEEVSSKRYEQLPHIFFKQKVFSELNKLVEKYSDEGVETGGFLNYERVESGLKIVGWHEYEDIERRENGIRISSEGSRDITKNQEMKRITFHSHPGGQLILSGAPSDPFSRTHSGDVGHLLQRKDGIEVLAKTEESGNIEGVFWAALTIRNQKSKDEYNVEYLPIHVVKDRDISKVIDDKYQNVKEYNRRIRLYYAGTELITPLKISESTLNEFYG